MNICYKLALLTSQNSNHRSRRNSVSSQNSQDAIRTLVSQINQWNMYIQWVVKAHESSIKVKQKVKRHSSSHEFWPCSKVHNYTTYVTGPTNIDHVSANYTELYFCQYQMWYPISIRKPIKFCSLMLNISCYKYIVLRAKTNNSDFCTHMVDFCRLSHIWVLHLVIRYPWDLLHSLKMMIQK